MKWLILILGIAFNASASVMVKFAMMPPRKFPSLREPISLLNNWPFWLGLIFYGVAFLLYAAALARFPLNIAYPTLTAGAIATVSVASVFVFREQFYATTVAGLFFVILGVILLTWRTS